MNLESDLREHVLEALPRSAGVEVELQSMLTGDLLIVYFNSLRRFVRPGPRTVHLSREFVAAGHERKSGVEATLAEIELGADSPLGSADASGSVTPVSVGKPSHSSGDRTSTFSSTIGEYITSTWPRMFRRKVLPPGPETSCSCRSPTSTRTRST